MEVTIRDETPQDVAAVREVNNRAFGQSLEGRLVDLMRANNGVLLSLVAQLDNQIVGHILFSPVTLDNDDGGLRGAGLGPMSVVPEFQRQGIGTQLINTGIDRLRDDGLPFIVVLGHPDYYPRFGFERGSQYGLRCEWEVPDEAFMILPIQIHPPSGLARYREEFKTVA